MTRQNYSLSGNLERDYSIGDCAAWATKEDGEYGTLDCGECCDQPLDTLPCCE